MKTMSIVIDISPSRAKISGDEGLRTGSDELFCSSVTLYLASLLVQKQFNWLDASNNTIVRNNEYSNTLAFFTSQLIKLSHPWGKFLQNAYTLPLSANTRATGYNWPDAPGVSPVTLRLESGHAPSPPFLFLSPQTLRPCFQLGNHKV